jgi:hypothetical protein
LWLDRKQANRHDAEIKVFTENCVLNRLGVAAAGRNIAGVLEFAGKFASGENSAGQHREPGKFFLGKVELQVAGLRSQEDRVQEFPET